MRRPKVLYPLAERLGWGLPTFLLGQGGRVHLPRSTYPSQTCLLEGLNEKGNKKNKIKKTKDVFCCQRSNQAVLHLQTTHKSGSANTNISITVGLNIRAARHAIGCQLVPIFGDFGRDNTYVQSSSLVFGGQLPPSFFSLFRLSSLFGSFPRRKLGTFHSQRFTEMGDDE